VCVCVRVCVYVRACVCVHVYVCACVRALLRVHVSKWVQGQKGCRLFVHAWAPFSKCQHQHPPMRAVRGGLAPLQRKRGAHASAAARGGVPDCVLPQWWQHQGARGGLCCGCTQTRTGGSSCLHLLPSAARVVVWRNAGSFVQCQDNCALTHTTAPPPTPPHLPTPTPTLATVLNLNHQA